jgi:LPXTG-motif cell wall-anchored protein
MHEASPDVELSVTYVGVPVGAPVATDAPAPTGPNCPATLATGLARTELSRSTIQGGSRAAAAGDSERLMQLVTVPAKTNFRDSWYSSPAALFASVKSGSLTIFTGNATSCTSQTYTAGQGAFVPADQVIFVRNDGSAPAEVYATRLALPAGAAPRVDAPNPGGVNCPGVNPVTQTLPKTGGSDTRTLSLAAGLLLVLGGFAMASGRRRTVVQG